jgi:hypothetical protein
MLRRILVLTVPALTIALVAVMLLAEVFVRITWDPRRGTPGLVLADPVLVDRLSPNYEGWFAGVPIRINNLGFRDSRDYDLRKTDRTFRILIVGDSVTFGHGSVYEHTYPLLLEQQLRKWRPEIDWQVWNTGVPGYTTTVELSYVRRVLAQFAPDLVVVGFFHNDAYGNVTRDNPGFVRQWLSVAKGFTKRHLYSYELYRRAYYGIAGALTQSSAPQEMLSVIAREEAILAANDLTHLDEQRLTNPVPSAPAASRCEIGDRDDGVDLVKAVKRDPGYGVWVDSVNGFGDLHRHGVPMLFFVNMAPNLCRSDDIFYDGNMRPLHDFFVDVLKSTGVPVISSYESFSHYRPSQVPLANGHSLGNSNWLKASLLFDFVSRAATEPIARSRD